MRFHRIRLDTALQAHFGLSTHRLSISGAVYLELALRKALPLATLDNALMNAARAEKVPLIGEGT